MLCPNDNTRMHSATVPSHYGQPVIIDQCGSCGGIWFDAFELYKVKQGEAASVEAVDPESLRTLSDIDEPTLLCPRDRTKLVQFDDPKFPREIILTRCPKCQGFWLNRGVFTQYQEARRKLMRPREKTPEDIKLNEDIKRMLQARLGGSSPDILARAGKFLSAPVGNQSLFPPGSGDRASAPETALDSILNILVLILRLFIFR